MTIQACAFDCFGTVFDMSSVSKESIAKYVEHVRRQTFEPYAFDSTWWNLKAHPDSQGGIAAIRKLGIKCVALSNGSFELISHISASNGIQWDLIIDLVKHRVYKPNLDAYRTVFLETGIPAAKTLMVTANPTFGDVEGSQAIGMKCQVIRQPLAHSPNTIYSLFEKLFAESRGDKMHWMEGDWPDHAEESEETKAVKRLVELATWTHFCTQKTTTHAQWAGLVMMVCRSSVESKDNE